jgi:hypothetical protein
MDNDSEQEGSLTSKDSAALSFVKGPARKGQPKNADRHRGQLSVTVCGHVSAHVDPARGCPDLVKRVLQGSQATQEPSGTSSRTKSFQLRLARLPRP